MLATGGRHRRLPPTAAGRGSSVSRTRPTGSPAGLVAALDAELLPMGSAGAKAMAVVRGEADIYAHSGGQYEWDSPRRWPSPLRTGLHVSRLDGSPLATTRPTPICPTC